MEILIIGLVAAFGLAIASRLTGRRQDRMLAQYEALEKRFRLERRTFRSKWGQGIGERHRLQGEYRGYEIALYSHFRKAPNEEKQVWTSLTMELLFVDELELDIQLPKSQPAARFSGTVGEYQIRFDQELSVIANRALPSEAVFPEVVRERVQALARRPECGAFRLSKGFLEYRESGLMLEDATRIRFQEALLAMGELADALSIFAAQERRRSN